jgi:hypothetical protein
VNVYDSRILEALDRHARTPIVQQVLKTVPGMSKFKFAIDLDHSPGKLEHGWLQTAPSNMKTKKVEGAEGF